MIDNLPNGWKEEKIGNIIDLTIGKTPSRKKSEYFTGDNLWVSIADIKSINLTNTKEKITEQAIKDSNIKKVKAGTLIMSYKLSIGKMAFTSQDLYTNEAIVALNIKINDLDKKFLYYYLLNADLEKTTDRAVKGKTLNKAKIEQIHIQFPPLQQQEKIVKVLDLTSNLIEKQKELLEKYDLFLKSKFIEMFGDPITNPMGWEAEKLENLIEKNKHSLKTGPFGSSLKKEFYVENGYKIYGQEQVIKNDFTYGNYYIDNDKYETLKNYSIKSDDILISLVGTFGKIAIVPKVFEEGIINPRLMKISLNKVLYNPVFFKYLFYAESFKAQLLSFSHGGTMGILNLSILKELKYIKPPIKLQNKFASIVEKIETIKEKENQKLKQFEDLHNSMMNKAFKGEIK
ncbi:restriction endonuclease subunit S [Aliarcobacter butzleri]|uniref:restriction endonuclease subunit S n=1 Tax=Aliarcobacter butzleri TaxID=28197 RepID=UPI0021B4DB3C|nr:restriction endonuclease subunit S [Aliarcobacter butzleri]MCT7578355.1 restriction endonuclease subunit S [Aliarcobacter butzleri]